MMWHTSLFLVILSNLCLLTLPHAIVSQNAPVTQENDPRLLHQAKLLDKDTTTIRGRMTIWSGLNDVGVRVHVLFLGLPKVGQYLTYHIHERPVPDDGNCYGTGAHLDLYKRENKPSCDMSAPQTCEIGDLSGKHGPVYAPGEQAFEVLYPDYFLSNVPDTAAYYSNL
ncbi:Cu,Zn superoxide dismutase-like protein [Aspergillus novoparasiticus]|uniref:Cu,Zn superoxide dismutase-like protein n=1 Tax=Aspergillus novoparasiticus TaxID=986946 RepID=A0A5N6E743_9EURO|nr:Cu,Zn superoxide dismutase-like protein [Aspergillus novoparasiticus]